MVVHKRKKVVKQRGSKTHGWGAMKKHRGAGNRGGRGMAGTGKHADTKKPSIWKEKYFGRQGFVNPKKNKNIKSITLKGIEEKLDDWKNKGLVKDNLIDLSKLGFTKLLSNGKITTKLNITVKYASKKAVEKIKKAGGKLQLKEVKKDVRQAELDHMSGKQGFPEHAQKSKISDISRETLSFTREEKKELEQKKKETTPRPSQSS